MNKSEIDRSILGLNEHKEEWARLPIGEKVAHLRQIREKVGEVAQAWVWAAAQAKGIGLESPLVGEEWMAGPWALLYGVNRLIETLQAIELGKPLLSARAVRQRANGQVVVDVFPQSVYDRLLLNDVRAEVWMQEGVTKDNLADTMATFYKEASPEGKVALVLAAGNVASIAPLDVLYKLIAEGQVCLLKMNPVNEYLGPFFEQIFASLVQAGFMRFAYGGVEVGKYLTPHEGIDEIHITGSAKTHHAIVYGTAGAVKPINQKRITSELGNVSPTIVVPGPWTDADLRFHAEQIASQKLQNAGFNCIAAQVLVLPEQWERTPDLLYVLRQTIRQLEPRLSYYPGSQARQQAMVAANPQAEEFDKRAQGIVPRTLITNIDPHDKDNICFREEAFCGVLAQTSLPGKSAADFLKAAVLFCNETLYGTLGANLIIHPATIKALGSDLEEAIADLRYGCVAINTWSGVGYFLTQTPWGAYPGHTYDDIQSGIGVVHNSFLFDKPQKSVIWGNFYPFPQSIKHGQYHIAPKPPWFVTNPQAHKLGRQLVDFELNPSPTHLPNIFISALRASAPPIMQPVLALGSLGLTIVGAARRGK